MLSSSDCGRISTQAGDAFPLAVITGGTGIVGSALVRQLAASLPHYKIILLTRRPEEVRSKQLTPIFADINYPDLRLDDKAKSLLHRRTCLIIHCAANTRFNLPLEHSRRTNTEGTRHMLKFALQCSRLEQLAHISTLYVAGRQHGLVPEAPLQHEAGYVNTYEEAKHEAEGLVLRQSGRLPIGIYRLSSVIDQSGSGGHFRQVVRFVPWCGQFPFFPADPNVPVDLIDCDWAAQALALLIVRHFIPGCIRHVCAGASSLSVGTVMDTVFSDRVFRSMAKRPSLIPLADFETLCRRWPLSSAVTRAMASLMTFIPHLSIPQPFDCTSTAKLLAGSGLPRPEMRALLSGVLANEFPYAEARA